MKKYLISVLVCTLIVAISFYISPVFASSIGSTFIFYPIWLFISIFGVSLSILALQSLINNWRPRIALAIIVGVILTPMIWCPSALYYSQLRTDWAFDALDAFIISIADAGKPPEGYELKGQLNDLPRDVSKTYEIVTADNFFNEYEIVVLFANGTKYYFAINGYGDNWDVYLHKLK